MYIIIILNNNNNNINLYLTRSVNRLIYTYDLVKQHKNGDLINLNQ